MALDILRGAVVNGYLRKERKKHSGRGFTSR
jgi:hypothetical protein